MAFNILFAHGFTENVVDEIHAAFGAGLWFLLPGERSGIEIEMGLLELIAWVGGGADEKRAW
ncbi:MAG: hypothetical protein M2R45_05052 [Verrucomicrobia subdivision 3 bacterium]|nr:hypothetical protein [Limisphaerales bacterium]MCS1412545.1 hypothetical protein [Limisphaerales bacterium]